MAGNAKNIRATRLHKFHESPKMRSPERRDYKEKCRIIFYKRQKNEQVHNNHSD